MKKKYNLKKRRTKFEWSHPKQKIDKIQSRYISWIIVCIKKEIGKAQENLLLFLFFFISWVFLFFYWTNQTKNSDFDNFVDAFVRL